MYSPEKKGYVCVNQLGRLVLNGVNVKVIDYQTKLDITAQCLGQYLAHTATDTTKIVNFIRSM
jgi:polyhydroxyalkanoate synthesis regulator protein